MKRARLTKPDIEVKYYVLECDGQSWGATNKAALIKFAKKQGFKIDIVPPVNNSLRVQHWNPAERY
jgi:hypothetical protein